MTRRAYEAGQRQRYDLDVLIPEKLIADSWFGGKLDARAARDVLPLRLRRERPHKMPSAI